MLELGAPCLLGCIAGELDHKGFDLFACLCSGLYAYRLRRRVQGLFGIVEPEDDSMIAIGCPCTGCCAITQDITELEVGVSCKVELLKNDNALMDSSDSMHVLMCVENNDLAQI